MDTSEKEEFSGEKRNDSADNHPSDWRISGSSNPVSAAPYGTYSTENLISSSCSPSQMMETLWYDHPTNLQAVGYGGSSSSSSCFRDRSLEMGWSLPNLLPPPKGNGLFPSFLPPPSMAQFPADSGFIERAARFSLFSDMVNQPLGNPESVGLFLQGQCPSSEVGVVAHNSVRSSEQQASKPNVSEDTTQSSGGQRGGETSSKGVDSKKRKRNRQCSEADQLQKSEEETDNNGDKKQSPNSPGNKTNSGKQASDPKDGYIHVRARRGQATNSHSLAERVRREKISERMKFLQDLVPGCNKVTGKAVMLDEIINYVQSLQRQVEFLSMKLSTVNPQQMDFNLEGLLAKDVRELQLRGGSSSAAVPFPQNMSMVYPPLPHGFMQQQVGRNISSPLSPMNGGYKRQETNGWEGDLQNVIHINYGAGDVPSGPEAAAAAAAAAATASLPSSNMKVEP